VAFAPIPATYENAKKGVLRMLAVTSLTRSSLAPEIPTIAEQGVPGFEAVLRYGVVAPADTPPAIVARLNKALNDALATDEIRKRLALEGAEPLPARPPNIPPISIAKRRCGARSSKPPARRRTRQSCKR